MKSVKVKGVDSYSCGYVKELSQTPFSFKIFNFERLSTINNKNKVTYWSTPDFMTKPI